MLKPSILDITFFSKTWNSKRGWRMENFAFRTTPEGATRLKQYLERQKLPDFFMVGTSHKIHFDLGQQEKVFLEYSFIQDIDYPEDLDLIKARRVYWE